MSIITAAFAPSADYLNETINGVKEQELPPGWELEWIIQEDGASPSLAGRFAGLDYVRYEASGVQLGIAASRNLALSRATGVLIQVLDQDDVPLPGALASLIPLFDSAPVHWAVGQADDLMPDGRRIEWESALPYGTIAAGTVNAWAESHEANWPIHCAGLMLRTTAVRAVGGWVGLPADEDVSMFAALSEISDGHNFDGITWLYRQHPHQVTRTQHTEHISAASRRFAVQRAKAIRLSGLTFGAQGQFSFDQNSHDVNVGPAAKVGHRPIP